MQPGGGGYPPPHQFQYPYPYYPLPPPPQLYQGAAAAGPPPGTSPVLPATGHGGGETGNRNGLESSLHSDAAGLNKTTDGRETSPRSPPGTRDDSGGTGGDNRRQQCTHHTPLEVNSTTVAVGNSIDPRLPAVLHDQHNRPENQPFAHFSRQQWRLHRTRWLFHRTVQVLLQAGKSLSTGTPTVCSVLVGDSQSHLFPWLKGTKLLSTTTGPQMKLVLFGETLPDLCLGLSCTEPMFASIKQEQNLHVSFAAFANKVIDLLSTVAECHLATPTDIATTEREATRPSGTDSGVADTINGEEPSRFLATLELADETGILTVVEATAFRSLTHISLKLERWKCCELRQALGGQLALRRKYEAYLEAHLRRAFAEWETAADLAAQREAELNQMKAAHTTEKRAIFTQHRDDLKRLAEEEEEKAKATAERLNNALARLNDEKGHLRQQVSDLLAAKRESDVRITELEAAVERAEGWEEEKRSIKEELQQLDLLKQTAARDADLRARNLMLEEKVEEFGDIANQLEKLRSENLEKSKQMAAYKSRLRDTTDRLEETSKNYETIQSQFTELREETEELRKVFETRNEAAKEREREAAKLTDKVQGLELECQKLLQANFELNKRLTESLVRMAKRDLPEHFDLKPPPTTKSGGMGDAGIADMLFPEATPSQSLANSMLDGRHSSLPGIQSAVLPQSGHLDDVHSPIHTRQPPQSHRLSLIPPQSVAGANDFGSGMPRQRPLVHHGQRRGGQGGASGRAGGKGVPRK